MDPAHFAKLPKLEHDEAAWQLVQKLKAAPVDLLLEHGAAHLQIGRTYKYRESLDPAADDLLLSIKKKVDPNNLMNPGSLGF